MLAALMCIEINHAMLSVKVIFYVEPAVGVSGF